MDDAIAKPYFRPLLKRVFLNHTSDTVNHQDLFLWIERLAIHTKMAYSPSDDVSLVFLEKNLC